jgi:hypothetical protein
MKRSFFIVAGASAISITDLLAEFPYAGPAHNVT